MSDNSGLKYVIDRPFGGTVSYDDIVGQGAPESDAPRQRVWPEIPLDYRPPPPEIENAVKEVSGILGYLQRTLSPTPLPDDDLQLMSDYVLSLKTRDDVTAHVLKHTDARSQIGGLSRILLKDDTKYNFRSRATALEKHWTGVELLISESTPEEILADRPIAPIKNELPDDKPAGWKLDVGETRAAEMQRQFDLLKMEKNRCVKYWTTVKPPKPMGWAPADGEAWKKVPRADIENGDLFFTPYFKPIWMSYGLAYIDALFWTDPDNTPEEEAEYKKLRAEKHELTELSLGMTNARKEYARSQGFTGVGLDIRRLGRSALTR